MHSLIKISIGCAMLLTSLFVMPSQASQITPVVTTSTTVVVLPTTTTTTTIATPGDALCGQWWALAVDVGFNVEMLPVLDQVLWRESRCIPTQLNATDPNGGSYGLTQVNGFWCQPSRYYPGGYLQAVGVLDSCDDLYDPRINLAAAYALVRYSLDSGLCTWQQWAWLDGCV